MHEPVVERRLLRGVGFVEPLGHVALGDPGLVGDLVLDLLEAGCLVRSFTDRQQVPALGVEQEEQPVQQRQGRLEDVGQFLLGRLLVQAEALLAVHEEALRQMREDREEDAILEPVAQALGVFPAAEQDVVEPAALALGLSAREGGGAQEQPPVPERFVRIGVARCGQRLDQIDFVEVRGSCMGLAAVEPPQPAVGDDDPVGGPCVEGRHDAGTGVFFRRVGIVQVRAVEPAVPGIDERRRQLAAVAAR